MSKPISTMDMTIHIDENLSEESRKAVIDKLLALNGVESAAINPNAVHILFVVFDPKNLTTHDVLNVVKSAGVHAEWTGG
jgi:hypothetical protein